MGERQTEDLEVPGSIPGVGSVATLIRFDFDPALPIFRHGVFAELKWNMLRSNAPNS